MKAPNSHMRTYPIPEIFTQYLEKVPESGMGYHIVDITYNNVVYEKQIILNCEVWYNDIFKHQFNYNPELVELIIKSK